MGVTLSSPSPLIFWQGRHGIAEDWNPPLTDAIARFSNGRLTCSTRDCSTHFGNIRNVWNAIGDHRVRKSGLTVCQLLMRG
jgi:hypothetical protein